LVKTATRNFFETKRKNLPLRFTTNQGESELRNFAASDNIYNEVLDVFQEVGEDLRSEIDEKFAEFRMRR